jgi:sporulation protein YlmC with PRC-barrel domain
MVRMSGIEGAEVFGSAGSRLGTVERVLFHPDEPRVVALMVKPNPALYVVAMPSAYLPFADVKFVAGDVRFSGAKLPSRGRTEKELGIDMDATVIWRGMPVASGTGRLAGTLVDANIDESGTLESLSVSTGGVGDVAYGRLDVPAGLVRGFDGRAVVIEAEADELETSGGVAKQAAAAAAAVKSSAGTAASATGDVIVDGSYIAGRAIRSAAKSVPVTKAKSAWKGLADAFKEGYDGPPKE